MVILLGWYKTHNICLICFFNLHEFFPAFQCANNKRSLVNSLFGVEIFNSVAVIFFRGFNFILSVIVSSGSNFTSFSSSAGGIGCQSSSSKSRINISGLFITLKLFFESSQSLSY